MPKRLTGEESGDVGERNWLCRRKRAFVTEKEIGLCQRSKDTDW